MRVNSCAGLTILVLAVGGCGGSTPTSQPTSVSGDMAIAMITDMAVGGGATNATVSVGPGIAFSPNSVTIARGGTVHWSWSGGLSHSVTSGTCSGTCTPDGKFTSVIQASGTFAFTFGTSGDFPYYCMVHGAMMTAVVHVTE